MKPFDKNETGELIAAIHSLGKDKVRELVLVAWGRIQELEAANSPETPDGWIACSERLPEIGEHDWRTAFPMLVNCEIGVIPAYYGFTYHEGEQCYGFLESLKFGDASGDRPEQYESKLMRHVTHWMPLPAAPKTEK